MANRILFAIVAKPITSTVSARLFPFSVVLAGHLASRGTSTAIHAIFLSLPRVHARFFAQKPSTVLFTVTS